MALSSCSLPIFKKNYKKVKRLVAVMEFENKSDKSFDKFKTFAQDSLISELYKKKKFRIIERERINVLLNEAALGQQGLIHPGQTTKIGKVLGADTLIISKFYITEKKSSYGFGKIFQSKRIKIQISITTRAFESTTGEILASVDATAYRELSKDSLLGSQLKMGSLDIELSVTKALKKAIKKVASGLAKQIKKKRVKINH